MKKSPINLLLAAALLLGITACDNIETVEKQPAKAETVRNLAADPVTGLDAAGRPASAGKHTFFSFKDGILTSADSASTRWDLAFRGVTILTNGGASGPGQGGAVVLNGIFDEIKSLPASATIVQDQKAALAIPTSSGKGWYNYNPQANLITPIAGKVIVVRTADGKHAKMEILSYYKDAPAAPTLESESRFYTFRYVYQPDGTSNF